MNHATHEKPIHRERLLNLKEPTLSEDPAAHLSLAELGQPIPPSPIAPEPQLPPKDGE